MAETKKTAAKAGQAVAKTATPAKKEKFIYGKGSRKTAVAQVRLFLKGQGEITINGKKLVEYFTPELVDLILKPLTATNHQKSVDITIRAHGGGKSSQAEACRHGIARALVLLNSDYRPVLKAEGFMTRDPRSKERKKPGLKRARRAPQWSKR